MAIDNLKGKRENSRPRKGENLRRRKETLFKKVYEVGKYDGVDVALILRQNGRYFTYRSIDLESWPPSMKEIVRLTSVPASRDAPRNETNHRYFEFN